MVHVIPLNHHLACCRWPGCEVEPVDTQIPLCERHFAYIGEVYVDQRTVLGSSFLAQMRPTIAERQQQVRDRQAERDRIAKNRSVVYYVRIGDFIKIGYTSMLRDRINGLRVDRDALLAIEPGWRDVEAERHAQFDAERQGKRENFNPSRRLLAHVDMVRSKYGEPWKYDERRRQAIAN